MSAELAIKKMKQEEFDLIISDQTLNEMDGIQLLRWAQKLAPNIPFIVITGYGSIERAVESVKKGAFEYIIKPFGRQHMLETIERAMSETSFRLNKKQDQSVFFENIVGKSKKMQDLYHLVSKIAPTNATVLIQGESGTGKELIAKAIHNMSPRKNSLFVAINCGVLSENLLENELFGHVKGAFTGATHYKKGLFEEAHKGTIFLDEIGDIPAPTQTKLLRVLQEKEFKALGSTENIKVDVRVIAATNVNLLEAVSKKRFRGDLYYRLAVIPIFVPALRDRIEDVPELATYFAEKYSYENNKKIEYISPEAMEKLMNNEWKGNVRELENTIERAVALATGNTISPELLWPGAEYMEMEEKPFLHKTNSLKDIISNNTYEAIVKALEITKGNRSKAAKLLGISRASFYHKLEKYGLK